VHSEQRRYFVIDIQQLIISVRNNIFQRNLAVGSRIYWKLSVGTKLCLNSFRFDIFIARRLGNQFLPVTLYVQGGPKNPILSASPCMLVHRKALQEATLAAAAAV